MSNTTTRLINALKTITSESQDIKFDKTVQGKIVAIVNEEQYRVSINNAIVLAYVTDGSTYKEGDSVYILIPEGDPSNIKTITGKVPLTSSAIVVTDPMEGISKVGMPFEDLYGLTGRRVSIIPDQSGVRKDVNIVNYDYPSRYEEIVETSKKYSHMMLTADFYNFFSDAASISKGSFGMHLTFSCLYENNYTTLEVELDSADMLGDIYSLAAPVTMYKFFSIPYGYVITGLEQVSIYQGGNFNGNINEATDWIIGGNIHLSFIDGENIRNNEIKFSLTTEDNGTYFSDEVDTLWLYGSTDKVVSGGTYFWFQQDDSVNSMSDSGYNQYGGIGWRLLDATTENKYAISNYDGFIQSNYKAVIVINTGQFYVSNIITLNQSGINIPQLKYHIEEDIIKFDLDFNKNEYEIYWRKENAMHNPIYDWAGEEDSYDAIESRAWYYVTVLKYGTGEIVYNAAKTIVSSAENGTIINDFSGALLHHYDANGDLSQDAQDSIYSLTAEMGDSVGGRWDLPADVVFPYQADDSLLVIQSVSANTIYYKLAPKYDANKMNNTLAYIIGDERYSQYITVLKDGDNGTNGTRYSAKIVRTPRSSKYLYHNGYNWVNDEYEVQVLVYKDGVSVEDFKVKQWLIPKTRAIINSVLKLQNDGLTCKIRFETDAEAIGLPWNKATVIGEVESSNDSLIYQWTVDGQIYSNTSTCKFDIEKDFEGQLQCVILDSHGDRVGEFNQVINAEAVDNSHTSLTNSAVGYYTKRINTDEDNHILSIGVEGTRDDIVNYYQNVVEAEIEVDGYSIFAYHAVPVCYGVNQVEIEEINSNVIYKSDGMNPQFTPFAIVSNITNPEITTLGQASIVGGEYTPASKFLYDEGMPAIRVTDVDSDSFCIIPIVTILNNYGLSYLNSWDGTSIEINEDGGYILAPQIGAGVKEEDNSFSGVLMGQLEGVSSNAGLVGLYGFDHGSASYGFLQDGTAFIGKSGLGQIKFDGNESTIMSANYEVNKKGMKLDLLNGTIDASGFNIDKNGNASFDGDITARELNIGKINLVELVQEDGTLALPEGSTIPGYANDGDIMDSVHVCYRNHKSYFIEEPQSPNEDDWWMDGDKLKEYNGEEWEELVLDWITDTTEGSDSQWSLKINPLGADEKLYSCVQTKTLDNNINNSQIQEDDGSGGGKAREQYIYYLSATNTSPTVPTTWCINTTDGIANWTTSPPTYTRTHPYKYVAIQTQSVAQQNYGGVCCNTSAALLDNTTTVIDGGHVSTGTIQSNTDQNGNFWDLNNGLLKIGEESSFAWLTHGSNIPNLLTYNDVSHEWIVDTTTTLGEDILLYTLNPNITDPPEHHCFSIECTDGLRNHVQVRTTNGNTPITDYDIVTGRLVGIYLVSGTSVSQGNYIKVNYHTGVINGNIIKAGTIDASLVNVTNINADNIATGTIDASQVTVTNIDADEINAGQVTADFIDIKGLTITGGKKYFSRDSITGTKYTLVRCNIPAGTYRLLIDNIVSSDTDRTTSRVRIFSSATAVEANLLYDGYFARGVPVEETLTLSAAALSIYIYASTSATTSEGDTFTFTNFRLYNEGDTETKLAIDKEGNFWTSGAIENTHVYNNNTSKIVIDDGIMAWYLNDRLKYSLNVDDTIYWNGLLFYNYDGLFNRVIGGCCYDDNNVQLYSIRHAGEENLNRGIEIASLYFNPDRTLTYGSSLILLPDGTINLNGTDYTVDNPSAFRTALGIGTPGTTHGYSAQTPALTAGGWRSDGVSSMTLGPGVWIVSCSISVGGTGSTGMITARASWDNTLRASAPLIGNNISTVNFCNIYNNNTSGNVSVYFEVYPTTNTTAQGTSHYKAVRIK